MTKWCPNPSRWLDMTIRFHTWDKVGFAICSQCWATHECILGEYDLEEIAEPGFHDRLMELWNAPRVRAIRTQWHEVGTIPRMCKSCPRLLADSDPPLDRAAIDDPWLLNLLDTGSTYTIPRVLSFGYDPSCNIACPSCRPKPFRLKEGDERFELLRRFQNQFVKRLLSDATDCHCTGYGDPFGSDLYLELLTTVTPDYAPKLRWYFLTNGLGFTEATYSAIPTREQIAGVNVSVDAATEDTYHKLRGGNWALLQKNLAFLSDIEHIEKFELGFVYQATNWREIPAFVDMAERLGADKILFYSLLNHTWDDNEYRAKAVHHPDHPEYEEAMNMLQWAKDHSPISVYVESENYERAGVSDGT